MKLEKAEEEDRTSRFSQGKKKDISHSKSTKKIFWWNSGLFENVVDYHEALF